MQDPKTHFTAAATAVLADFSFLDMGLYIFILFPSTRFDDLGSTPGYRLRMPVSSEFGRSLLGP